MEISVVVRNSSRSGFAFTPACGRVEPTSDASRQKWGTRLVAVLSDVGYQPTRLGGGSTDVGYPVHRDFGGGSGRCGAHSLRCGLVR